MSGIQVQSTSTASNAHGIKAMIYGASGVGKTSLAVSAPRPIILSAENGLLSLRKFNLPYIKIDNVLQLKQAYTYLIGSAGQQFDTILLDSASEIAEQCLYEAKRTNKDARKAYGDTQDEMIDIFRKYRDIPNKHVIFLAKQEFTTDGQTGAKYFAPAFPGNKLAQAAPYFFDEVWQLTNFTDQTTGAKIRALRTSPDNQNTAKDRSGVLAEWENADPNTGGGLTYLFNKMLRG